MNWSAALSLSGRMYSCATVANLGRIAAVGTQALYYGALGISREWGPAVTSGPGL